jgi:hypothetical protein
MDGASIISRLAFKPARAWSLSMSSDVELLKRVYARFNARDLEGVLATMHGDVMWANGMEGGTSTDARAFAAIGRASGR